MNEFMDEGRNEKLSQKQNSFLYDEQNLEDNMSFDEKYLYGNDKYMYLKVMYIIAGIIFIATQFLTRGYKVIYGSIHGFGNLGNIIFIDMLYLILYSGIVILIYLELFHNKNSLVVKVLEILITIVGISSIIFLVTSNLVNGYTLSFCGMLNNLYLITLYAIIPLRRLERNEEKLLSNILFLVFSVQLLFLTLSMSISYYINIGVEGIFYIFLSLANIMIFIGIRYILVNQKIGPLVVGIVLIYNAVIELLALLLYPTVVKFIVIPLLVVAYILWSVVFIIYFNKIQEKKYEMMFD